VHTTDAVLATLELTEVGTDRYTAANLEGHAVVFGGQLLAQSIVAALRGNEAMAVKTIHSVFPRAGRPDAPVEIEVDRMHAGRTFASSTVTVTQGDRLVTRSLVLMDAAEDDLIRHADAPAAMPSPDDAPGSSEPNCWQFRFVDGVDIVDPDAVGPAELGVWTRFEGAPGDAVTGQALLSFATDGFLIGTAMRPHAGVGQAQAHKTLSTGVLSHTLTFHEPVDAGSWMLMANESPYAGHGRAYGRAHVFASDGRLVASFVQDSMIRPLQQSAGGL
jgi:acyl-CoA thioesterase-2